MKVLKIKDNVDLKELEKYGFEKSYFQPKNWLLVYREYINKIIIDKNRVLHYNAPTISTFDLIYKMHDLLEYTDDVKDLRMNKIKTKDKINKAIEYIENTYSEVKNEDGSLPLTLHDQELLDILKGSDNNGHNKK